MRSIVFKPHQGRKTIAQGGKPWDGAHPRLTPRATLSCPLRGLSLEFLIQDTSKARCVLLMLILAACTIPAMAGFAALPPKPTLEQVGNQVYCLCGCVTTLNRCPHLPSECSSRAEMEAVILKDIDQGKDGTAILADLTGRYGVRVLASPPAKGFDLTVWILPGIGLIIGLVVVLTIVRRWRRKPGPSRNSAVAVDAQVMAAVEEEMNRIESLNH